MIEKLKSVGNYVWVITAIVGILTIAKFCIEFIQIHVFPSNLTLGVIYPDYQNLRYITPDKFNYKKEDLYYKLKSITRTNVDDSVVQALATEISCEVVDTFLLEHLALYHNPTFIDIANLTNKTFNNVKINCPFDHGYYYNCPLQISDELLHKAGNYVMANYQSFSGGVIELKEVHPGQVLKYAVCVLHTTDMTHNNALFINADHQPFSVTYESGEAQEIFPEITMIEDSKFDYFITHQIGENKVYQVFIYIFVFLGAIYFLIIIKKGVYLIKETRDK